MMKTLYLLTAQTANYLYWVLSAICERNSVQWLLDRTPNSLRLQARVFFRLSQCSRKYWRLYSDQVTELKR